MNSLTAGLLVLIASYSAWVVRRLVKHRGCGSCGHCPFADGCEKRK